MQYQFKKRLTSTSVKYRYAEANSDEVKDGETRLEKLYTNEVAAKAALQKLVPGLTILKIVSVDPITELYGLTRDELRQYGHKIENS